MYLDNLHTIEDLRVRAKRRLPKVIFDFLDGGAGEERGLARNRSAFEKVSLSPKYFNHVPERDLTVSLFNQQYDAPVGIAPMGIANLIWPGADGMLAGLAHEANIPYILSSVGSTSLEDIARIAPQNTWLQLYLPDDDKILLDLLSRAGAVGISVLVITVDVPVMGKRHRDIRNGFAWPFRPTLAQMLNIASRPAWALATMRAGVPRQASLAKYSSAAYGDAPGTSFIKTLSVRRHDPERIKFIRDHWPGTLVVKGLLDVEEASRAAALGVDGIIVSNHGGRQLEAARASFDALGGIARAVGDRLTVMLDSGIRSGSDIVKAYGRGAEFVFCGRAFGYGIGAGQRAGAQRSFDILVGETEQIMTQAGEAHVSAIAESLLVE